MDFIPTTIRGLFDTSIQFVIPVYQRAYSWQKDNWNVFLQDLMEQVTIAIFALISYLSN